MTSEEAADKLLEQLNVFVSSILSKPKYKPVAPKGRSKAFHDAVWGTNIFSPAEIALLDSPLIQRLRFIHQTGLTFYTFDCADHNRFAHTLGTTIVSTKIATSLNNKDTVYVDSVDLQKIRIAAILHDCGHGIFSHVSESFYKNSEWIIKIKLLPRFEHAKAHEILSYFLVKTNAVRDLFNEIQRRYDDEEDIKKIDNWDEIADLILGIAPDEKFYLGQIINGPFDADKLDYIARDSYFTGLKLAVDIERLLYVIEVHNINGRNLITGSVTGGSNSFEQILRSKIQMYSSLYYHPKVKAVDMLLNNFFRYIEDNISTLPSKPFYFKVSDPVEALKYTDMDLLNPMLHKNPYLKKVVNSLRLRKLPMKALVISSFTVFSGLRILTDAAGTSKWHEKQSSLQRQICQLVRASNSKFARLSPYDIMVSLPEIPPLHEAESTYLYFAEGEDPILLSELFPTALDWLNTFSLSHWRGYVFCPLLPNLQREVAECAVDVFEREFPGVTFNKYAIEFANHYD